MSLIVKCFWFAVVCVLLGFWLEVYCSGVEWTAANCWPSQVWVCSHPVPGTYSIAVGHWKWSVCVFLYFIAMSLSVRVNGHFSRWTWVSQYQNIFIQDFLELRMMEMVVTTLHIYKTCKATVISDVTSMGYSGTETWVGWIEVQPQVTSAFNINKLSWCWQPARCV